ncbi:MAG: hypothetical protein WCL27_07225 [Betaproteobacteria bacterium]
MRGVDFPPLRSGRLFQLALVVSLLLHAAVLFLSYSPDLRSGQTANSDGDANAIGAMRPRLQATLARPTVALRSPASAPVESTLQKPVESSNRQLKQKRMTAPTGVWANRTWTKAERAEMDKFLNELATQTKPLTGQALAQKALAMARQLARTPQEGKEDGIGRSDVNGKFVEPLSLEMYFDSFVRKMNRSAAFVKNDPRPPGRRKALVEIALNSDGSLKSYRVLRSGDQEAEIAYIKSVVERASPFSAFPPDIRRARDSLTVMMCIYPPHLSGGGGFSRSFGAQDCD